MASLSNIDVLSEYEMSDSVVSNVSSGAKSEKDVVYSPRKKRDRNVRPKKSYSNEILSDAKLELPLFGGRIYDFMRWSGILMLVGNIISMIFFFVVIFVEYYSEPEVVMKQFFRYAQFLPPFFVGNLCCALKMLSARVSSLVTIPEWGASRRRFHWWLFFVALVSAITLALMVYYFGIAGSKRNAILKPLYQVFGVYSVTMICLTLCWLVSVFRRVFFVSIIALKELKVQPTLHACCVLHDRVRGMQEDIEGKTKIFVGSCMITLIVVVVWAVLSAMTLRFSKAVLLMCILVIVYFVLNSFAIVNALDGLYIHDVAAYGKSAGSYHRVYGTVKLLQMHPIQYDFFGFAITTKFITAYTISAILAVLGALSNQFVAIATSGYL